MNPPAGWEVRDGALERRFAFPDFATALAFAVRIGAVAEAQNHHPELTVGWGTVVVRTWSHDVDAITERDRQLAVAIDGLT